MNYQMNDSPSISLCLISNELSNYFISPWGELLFFRGKVNCYSFTQWMTQFWHSFFRVFTGACVVGLILWLVLDTAQRPEQLISFGGICMFILILFVCSKHHSAVSFGYLGWASSTEQRPSTNYEEPMSSVHYNGIELNL